MDFVVSVVFCVCVCLSMCGVCIYSVFTVCCVPGLYVVNTCCMVFYVSGVSIGAVWCVCVFSLCVGSPGGVGVYVLSSVCGISVVCVCSTSTSKFFSLHAFLAS